MAATKFKIPEDITWKRIKPTTADKPKQRRYASAVLHNGQMIVFGGTGPDKSSKNDLWAFDLEKLAWNEIKTTNPPSPRYGHSAAICDEKMYIFGGTVDGKVGLNDLFSFDFKSQTWEELKPENPPPTRFQHSSALIDCKIFVFGGSQDIKVQRNDTWSFCTKSKSWTKHSPTSTPSARAGSVAWAYKSTLFILGGFAGEGGFDTLLDMWKFSEENGWSECELGGTLPVCGRPTPSPVISSEDNVAWFYGGWDGKAPLGNLLAFDLENPTQWKHCKMEMELDLDQISLAAKGTKGLNPIPRYGHVMVMHQGVITVALGSGSMYLDDVFQIDTNEEEE